MIPIKYTGNLTAYEEFCRGFMNRLNLILQRGYIGKRQRITVFEAKRKVATLTGNQKTLFSNNVGDRKGNWTTLQDSDMVEAPIEMLDDESKEVLQLFCDHFDEVVNADDAGMLKIIAHAKRIYKPLTNKDKVYENICKVVIGQGYEHRDFPRSELIKATKIKVCPYCNRVFVECIEGHQREVKGQLDHFYPKEKYPYLAISKYNLVPSCSYCNGASGKHNKDSRIEGLQNPFFIRDVNSMVFKADILQRGFLNLKSMESAIDVGIDVSLNTGMTNNVRVFNLKELYNSHKDYVAEVYFKCMKMKSPAYRTFVKRMSQTSGNSNSPLIKQVSIEDWERLVLGVYNEPEEFSKRPLSKFVHDIFEGLVNERKSI